MAVAAHDEKYLAVLDDAAFSAATEVISKFIRTGRSGGAPARGTSAFWGGFFALDLVIDHWFRARRGHQKPCGTF